MGSPEKSSKLKVILNETEDQEIPHCKHGPALLFTKYNEKGEICDTFYACSAERNKEDCPLLNPDDFEKSQKYFEDLPTNEKFIKTGFYCKKCQKVGINLKSCKIHSTHPLVKYSQNFKLTNFLEPLGNDKKEAQYFFSHSTLKFFLKTFKNLKIDGVLCLGAPALHDYLLHNEIDSFLMDIDERLYSIYSPERFSLFNMFNYHFFHGNSSKENFQLFLKNHSNLVIFTDPPFGCRTEPLFLTINRIKQEHSQFHSHQILSVIWIFPYFMENYIKQVMPELEMNDFKVNYTNHETYNETSKTRKDLGSPVRMFTNIFSKFLQLPPKDYKFCTMCDRWTQKLNKHCHFCGICPSKNGSTYIHCKKCRLCVKPNFKHCEKCKKCTLKTHDCKVFQRHVRCGVCEAKGHVEINCKEVTLKNSKKSGNCWFCHEDGHIVQNCASRKKFE